MHQFLALRSCLYPIVADEALINDNKNHDKNESCDFEYLKSVRVLVFSLKDTLLVSY